MQTTLSAQLEALYAEYEHILPAATLAKMNQANADLAASGIVDRCLKAGDMAPPFALPDSTGKMVELSTLLQKGPVVISFFRGGWCTFCNLEVKELQRRLPDVKRAGARLIAITPQRQEAVHEMVEAIGLGYPVLSDAGNAVARKFGLVFQLPDNLKPVYEKGFKINVPEENGDPSYELPIPSTFVVARDGRIAAAFHDPNYFRRMEPQAIVDLLESL